MGDRGCVRIGRIPASWVLRVLGLDMSSCVKHRLILLDCYLSNARARTGHCAAASPDVCTKLLRLPLPAAASLNKQVRTLSTMPPRPRKGHRKSRNGCGNCKKRKIKVSTSKLWVPAWLLTPSSAMSRNQSVKTVSSIALDAITWMPHQLR